MSYYFKNLLTALCGRNPYRQELDKLKEEMEKAGENVRALRDSYYKEVEKAAEADKLREKAERLLAEYEGIVTKSEKQLASYQTLVDNLRARVKEKDADIEEMRKDYRRQVESYEKRVGGYCVTIAELQEKVGELQDTDSRQAAVGKENMKARGKEEKSKSKTKDSREMPGTADDE